MDVDVLWFHRNIVNTKKEQEFHFLGIFVVEFQLACLYTANFDIVQCSAMYSTHNTSTQSRLAKKWVVWSHL